MTIDLSKLSPTHRREICELIRKKVGQQRRDMDVDLEHWRSAGVPDDNAAHVEMKGWREACTDVESQALRGM